MIVLVTNKLITRSKLPYDAFFEFWSHEKRGDREIESIIRNFDPMKNEKNSISWIRPHDQKFDLLKKLNFDLMKFDLMIISSFKGKTRQRKTLKSNLFKVWQFCVIMAQFAKCIFIFLKVDQHFVTTRYIFNRPKSFFLGKPSNTFFYLQWWNRKSLGAKFVNWVKT
jgi:hypothetical protein